MAVTPASPTSNYTAQDYQVPNVDPSLYKTNTYNPTASLGANSYKSGSDAYQLNDAYRNNLGYNIPQSDLAWRGGRFNVTPLNQQLQDIAGLPQAQQYRDTYGRAANEINPGIDSQIQAYQRQAENARQAGQSQLGSLVPEYNSQRSNLAFGLGQNNLGLDQQLGALRDQTDFAGQRLQSQISPAILAARESAARSGLLNSTVAIDRVNMGLLPIQQRLGDLAQSYQTSSSGIDQKRQSYVANYQQQLQDLGSKQSAAAKAIQDQVALQLQQYADQAAQSEATRNSQVQARAGSLGDLQRQFGLQQQQVGGYLQNLQATQAQQGPLNAAQANYYNQLAAHAK